MRTHLPVTQRQPPFPSGFNLMSTADLKGRTSTHIAEIHRSVEAQSCAIVQINAALRHIEQLTEQNSGMVHELADASAALTMQSGAVADAMRVIRLSGSDVVVNSDAVDLRRRIRAQKLPPTQPAPLGWGRSISIKVA